MLINLIRRFPQVTNLELEWTIPCTEEYFLDRKRHDCKGASVRRTRDGLEKYIRDHAGKGDLASDVRVHLQWGECSVSAESRIVKLRGPCYKNVPRIFHGTALL